MGISDEVATAAIETVLKPLGTSLKHYMAVHKAAAVEAMRGVLTAERDQESKRTDERIEAARQFVKRHPSLTLIDLAEFEAFVGVPDALTLAFAKAAP